MRALVTAALFLILVTPSVLAQAWIGEIAGQMARNEGRAGEQCLLGPTSFSDRAMASARDGVMTTMTSYLASASASSSANVSASFSRGHRQQVWIADDVPGNVQSVRDPLAQRFSSGGVLSLPPPDALVRSGDEETVEALWILRDASDTTQIVGSYLARFRHEGFRGWVLTRLAISTRTEAQAAPAPYCHVDGDIAPAKPKPSETTAASDPESPATEQAPPSSAAPTP